MSEHSIKKAAGKSRLTESIRPSTDYEYYGTARADKPFSMSLKLLLKNGKCMFLFYHDLISPIEFDGSTMITLKTHNMKAEINGRKLADLADLISEHKVVWIKENDGSFFSENEGMAIDTIEIKEI